MVCNNYITAFVYYENTFYQSFAIDLISSNGGFPTHSFTNGICQFKTFQTIKSVRIRSKPRIVKLIFSSLGLLLLLLPRPVPPLPTKIFCNGQLCVRASVAQFLGSYL